MESVIGGGISVILPSFNAGAFIESALRSILGQTRLPDEVIVIDDGSTDGTAGIVESIGSPLIRYIRQPNQGVSTARNRGLKEARGEFIAFLDADDLWRPTALETHLRLMAADPEIVFTFGDFERFEDETGRRIGTQFIFYPLLDRLPVDPIEGGGWLIRGDAFERLIPFGEFPSFTQVMMFRRSLIGGVDFDPELKICEDSHFVLRAAMRGKAAFTRDILADVRRHDANATADYSLIAHDKLRALERLEPFLTSPQYRTAVQDRLARAHFDVAALYARGGERAGVLSHWYRALGTEAPVSRKVRSTLGLLRRWILSP